MTLKFYKWFHYIFLLLFVPVVLLNHIGDNVVFLQDHIIFREAVYYANPVLSLVLVFFGLYVFVFNKKKGKSEIWAQGKAPLFPNQEVVVTKKLIEPFELDLVAVFVMEYEGITKKINAKLSVNWDEIYVQRGFSAKTDWSSVDIKESLYKLKESGIIKLEVTGDSSDLTRIWDIAYEHLIHQMFDVQEIRMDEQTSLGVEFEIGHQNLIYTLKKERKTGSYHIDFNRRFKDKRKIVLVSDIGDTIKKAISQKQIDY